MAPPRVEWISVCEEAAAANGSVASDQNVLELQWDLGVERIIDATAPACLVVTDRSCQFIASRGSVPVQSRIQL